MAILISWLLDVLNFVYQSHCSRDWWQILVCVHEATLLQGNGGKPCCVFMKQHCYKGMETNPGVFTCKQHCYKGMVANPVVCAWSNIAIREWRQILVCLHVSNIATREWWQIWCVCMKQHCYKGMVANPVVFTCKQHCYKGMNRMKEERAAAWYLYKNVTQNILRTHEKK